MRKISFLCLIIIIVLCTGCSTISQKSPEAITITPTPPIILRPLMSLWEWETVDLPTLSTENYSITIFAMRLTGQDTIILCSITGAEGDKFAGLSTTVQLRDNSGRISNVVSLGTIAVFDSIELGFLKFTPRPISSNELVFRISQNTSDTGFIDLPIAKFVNPPEDPSVYNIRTYLLSTDQIFEQNGFRISFYGWVAPSSAKLPVTPSVENLTNTPGAAEGETENLVTPTPIVPLATNLPEGITVSNAATLQIEDNNGKTVYVYMQLLSDGEIIGVLIE